MTSKVRQITQETLIPLSLVFVLAGGLVWITSISTVATTNAHSIALIKDHISNDVSSIKLDVKDINHKANMIESRLSRIEGLLQRGNRGKE